MAYFYINFILVFIEVLVCSVAFKDSRIRNRAFLLIVFFQLFILHAYLDPDMMQDLPGYMETYQEFGENSLRESILVGYVGVKMEPGWILLCKLLYFISHNPRTLLIFSSLLMVGGYCITISRYSFLPWLSVFIYLCTTFDQSLFVLRQHCAIAITLLSIPLIIKRKFLKFIILMIVAAMIHSTVAIFVPMYFVYNINLKKYWPNFITLAIVGVVISGTIFPWLFSHTWYGGYGDRDGSNYTLFFINLCSFLLYLVSIKFRINKLSSVDKYFFLLLSMALLLCLCGAGFSPTNRLAKYFSVASIIVIPRAISNIKVDYIKVIITVVVVVSHFLLFLAPSNSEYIKDYRLIF